MTDIYLIRIDDPDETQICLSKGNTPLGRGALLGCNDKRISRNHGQIQISDDGIITLISLHNNPCFYKALNLDSYVVIKKGQTKVLHAGDEFTLLPNAYRYRIAVKPEAAGAESTVNGVPYATQNGDNEDVNRDLVMVYNKAESTGQSSGTAQEAASSTSSVTTLTQSPNRKRALPSWLLNEARKDTSNSTPSDSTVSSSADTMQTKKKTTSVAASSSSSSAQTLVLKKDPSTDEPVGKKARINATEEDALNEGIKIKTEVEVDNADSYNVTPPTTKHLATKEGALDVPVKIKTEAEDNADAQCTCVTPPSGSASVSCVCDEHQSSSEEDDVKPSIGDSLAQQDPLIVAATTKHPAMQEDASDVCVKIKTEPKDYTDAQSVCVTPPSGSASNKCVGDEHQLSSEEDDVKPSSAGSAAECGSPSVAASAKPNSDDNQNSAGPPARDQCIYGASCYRKNPQHREEYSHPGDKDYKVNPDVPECPYGTACYRKNLQHRKDYKHTQPPTVSPNRNPAQSNAFSTVTFNVCPQCCRTTYDDLTDDDDGPGF